MRREPERPSLAPLRELGDQRHRDAASGVGGDAGSATYEPPQSPSAPLAAMARRQALLLLIAAVVLLGLLGRTAWWQIVQGPMLAQRAAAESLRTLSIPAQRGAILDANGAPLAISVTHDTVVVDPALLRSAGTLPLAERTLSAALGLPEASVAAQLNPSSEYALLNGPDGQPLLLTEAQSAALGKAINAAQLQGGIALEPQTTRDYPDGALAAQTLGFVRLSDGAGQYGVEQMENSVLGGAPGKLTTRVNSAGQPLALAPLRQTTPIPGANVTLTLDANVQQWAEQGLAHAVQATGADGGEVIVLDPTTGAIIALASSTGFDPNQYYNSPLTDFSNPAISDTYDPGSVMKAMTISSRRP